MFTALTVPSQIHESIVRVQYMQRATLRNWMIKIVRWCWVFMRAKCTGWCGYCNICSFLSYIDTSNQTSCTISICVSKQTVENQQHQQKTTHGFILLDEAGDFPWCTCIHMYRGRTNCRTHCKCWIAKKLRFSTYFEDFNGISYTKNAEFCVYLLI